MASTDLSGAAWFKSSHSGSQGDCVEVAWLPEGRVGVRDSKNPTGPALVFTPGAWDAFTVSTAYGEFDRPA
ncbi:MULTISPECIES: DUF397 domain-containing protein [unclassified Nocardia]|uniref:DUF397 domain-containing protein n=1 Tax=unclassified Nocardia TaxID=2637762 RepID=UPI0024A9A3E9|nr:MULTISPECIES: DUF397 domain-containing protein [unclassified Nocardia]